MPTYMIRRNGVPASHSIRPWQTIENDLLKALNYGWESAVSETQTFRPKYDLVATEAEVRASIVLPGLSMDSIGVEVQEKTLIVTGSQIAREFEAEGVTVLHQSIPQYGEFKFEVNLPYTVDSAKTVANYRDGILNVTLPRHQATLPVKIAVQTGAPEVIESVPQVESKRKKTAE